MFGNNKKQDEIIKLLKRIDGKLTRFQNNGGFKFYWYIDANNNIRQRLCKTAPGSCSCRYHNNNWNCFETADEAEKALDLINAIFNILKK